MITTRRRHKQPYFECVPGDPAPLSVRVKRRVLFGETDLMGVLWHGNYASFFESAISELARVCGLGYADYAAAGLRAPIAQFHVDYLASAILDEEVTLEASMFWNMAARINTEFAMLKSNGRLAARGYMVQLFTNEIGEPLLASPQLLIDCRNRWRAGEFASLQ